MRPDKTLIEEILCKLKIPASEYLVQSYVKDSLYREGGDVDLIMGRLVPPSVEIDKRDWQFLAEYINSVLEEFRESYNLFTDKAAGFIRQRAGELHTAVINLSVRLNKGDIDASWLPRHAFIILSQIQSHTASVMEDLDSDESFQEAELEVIDNSLESMIETYEDMKELIDEAFDSFRRNKLALVRSGNTLDTVTELLIQLSITGIDAWRRLIVNESCTLLELHQIIQIIFGWHDSHSFKFGDEEEFDLNTPIKELKARNIIEFVYEYGAKWSVRIMILSRYESPGYRLVRCVAGAGVSPPEFIESPLKFKKILSALENGNDIERLGAQQELGMEYIPTEFDLEACNRSLKTSVQLKGYGPDR
jgi:hypothetical protein